MASGLSSSRRFLPVSLVGSAHLLHGHFPSCLVRNVARVDAKNFKRKEVSPLLDPRQHAGRGATGCDCRILYLPALIHDQPQRPSWARRHARNPVPHLKLGCRSPRAVTIPESSQRKRKPGKARKQSQRSWPSGDVFPVACTKWLRRRTPEPHQRMILTTEPGRPHEKQSQILRPETAKKTPPDTTNSSSPARP